MDLHEALSQISEIRQHVARTETYRGFRAAPVAFSGLVACVAAVFQAAFISDPAANLPFYLCLWVGSAVGCLIFTGVTMYWHCLKSASTLTRSNTLLAIGNFAPSVVAGGLVTFVLYQIETPCQWMLPGLWAIFFSFGVFAIYRLLPKATFGIGVFYLLAGVFSLIWARDANAFSPWAMAVPFGVGQLVAAGILYWTLERNNDDDQ